jgi:hypothetical protein
MFLTFPFAPCPCPPQEPLVLAELASDEEPEDELPSLTNHGTLSVGADPSSVDGDAPPRRLERHLSTVSVASSGADARDTAAMTLPQPGLLPPFAGLAERFATQLQGTAVSVREQRSMRKAKQVKGTKRLNEKVGAAGQPAAKKARKVAGWASRSRVTLNKAPGSAAASSAVGGQTHTQPAKPPLVEPPLTEQPMQLVLAPSVPPEPSVAPVQPPGGPPTPLEPSQPGQLPVPMAPVAALPAPLTPVPLTGPKGTNGATGVPPNIWLMCLDTCHTSVVQSLPEDALPQNYPGKHSYTLKHSSATGRITVLSGAQREHRTSCALGRMRSQWACTLAHRPRHHKLRLKQKAFYVKPVECDVAARMKFPRDGYQGVFVKWSNSLEQAWATARALAGWDLSVP